VIGQHLPPDYTRGDESTVGGYAAVHGRPATFEGADGVAYSVDILVDETDESDGAWGAYLFFVRWSAGTPVLAGHVESPFLARGRTAEEARTALGRWPLGAARTVLEGLIRERDARPR